MTSIAIAQHVGCSQSYVCKLAQVLGLPPRGKGHQAPDVAWSAEDDDRLRALWSSGMARNDISRALHRTFESVRSRARRLGLTRRPRIAAPRAVQRPQPNGKIRLYPAPKLTPVPPRPARVETSSAPCQFIPGDPSADDACKCGAPSVVGRPYCPEHLAMVYLPKDSPAEQRAAKAIDAIAAGEQV